MAARYDIEAVRRAASGRWGDIVSSIGSVPRECLTGKHGPCPKCGGKDRFRAQNDFPQTGGVLCGQCFSSRNGDGFAAIQWLCGIPFPDALRRVAEFVGVSPQAGGRLNRPIDPAKDLEPRPWNQTLVALWCRHKPGITPAAIQRAGGILARYRDQFTVIALPVWGPMLRQEKPVGWCLFAIGGGKLPRKLPDGGVELVKVKLTYGSQPGVMGVIGTGEDAWKTEGPTDMLAQLSLADIPSDVTVICNAFGAKEDPAKTLWIAKLFEGKKARVVHDCDEPGQQGAMGVPRKDAPDRPGWAPAIAQHATECRNVLLPYPVSKDHGKDLRDWTNEPHTYADLVALADSSPVILAPSEALKAIEADDDPHRLARANLLRYATHAAGATIRYWRDEWYTWKPSRGCYRKIGVEELRAKVTHSVKAEFDAINVLKQSEPHEDVPTTKKVTKALITNVVDATKSLVIVPSSVELMSWLDGPERQRKNYVAMANGVLDLDRLLADENAELPDVLLPHSPAWFSTIRLPYNFEPDAKCPRWEKFLEKNLELDPERIKILQEWAGYLLLPETGQQKFLALEGEGSNGKSVYCAAITAMLGLENCSHVSVEQLCDKFVRTQTLGRLVNICPDVGDIDRANEGDLKSFVSGDVMFFDRKHLSGLNCTPTARLMMSFNNRPRFTDRSMGIWRRMMLIPFNVQIQEHERVPNMDKHTWWEQSGELPGIFLWAVAGLHRLRKQGRFTKSQMSESAIEDYRSEANPARAFLLECCEPASRLRVKTSSLYRFYKVWAESHGYRALGERSFGKEIVRTFPGATRVFVGTRGDRYWCYENLKISQDEICGMKTSEELLL